MLCGVTATLGSNPSATAIGNPEILPKGQGLGVLLCPALDAWWTSEPILGNAFPQRSPAERAPPACDACRDFRPCCPQIIGLPGDRFGVHGGFQSPSFGECVDGALEIGDRSPHEWAPGPSSRQQTQMLETGQVGDGSSGRDVAAA